MAIQGLLKCYFGPDTQAYTCTRHHSFNNNNTPVEYVEERDFTFESRSHCERKENRILYRCVANVHL